MNLSERIEPALGKPPITRVLMEIKGKHVLVTTLNNALEELSRVQKSHLKNKGLKILYDRARQARTEIFKHPKGLKS